MSSEQMNPVLVQQEQLDGWRAYAEQTRTDLFTVRQLISRGQSQAAAQLIGGMIESAIIAGLGMEAAGAARPATLPPKREHPTNYDEDQDED